MYSIIMYLRIREYIYKGYSFVMILCFKTHKRRVSHTIAKLYKKNVLVILYLL